MIDAKEAAQRASQYLQNLISGVTSMTLEEVELTNDEQFWLITLSYNEPSTAIQNIWGGKNVKIFKVKRNNGEVMAMKIRTV